MDNVVFLETQVYTSRFPNVPFIKINNKKNTRLIMKTYFKHDIIEFREDMYISSDRLVDIVENNIIRNNNIILEMLTILNMINRVFISYRDIFISRLQSDIDHIHTKKDIYSLYHDISHIKAVEDLYFLRIFKHIEDERIRLYVINMFDIDIVDNFILKHRWKDDVMRFDNFYDMYLMMCKAHNVRCMKMREFRDRVLIFFDINGDNIYRY